MKGSHQSVLLVHPCAFEELAKGSECTQYKGAEEAAIKTHNWGANKGTRQGAMALLLDKKEQS